MSAYTGCIVVFAFVAALLPVRYLMCLELNPANWVTTNPPILHVPFLGKFRVAREAVSVVGGFLLANFGIVRVALLLVGITLQSLTLEVSGLFFGTPDRRLSKSIEARKRACCWRYNSYSSREKRCREKSEHRGSSQWCLSSGEWKSHLCQIV